MELEQHIMRVNPEAHALNSESSASTVTIETTRGTSESSSHRDLCDGSESFRTLKMDIPAEKNTTPEERLSWVQSQIIGSDSEFDSPFGRRRLTYADHTASGRSLSYIENFIVRNALPFYGNTHTCDSYVGKHTTGMVKEATDYIKNCLGGSENDALLFCGSGTTAAIKRLQEVMGIAVPAIWKERLLNCLKEEERWVVFVGPYEHHSNILSWRQSLAEVVEIGLDEDGLVDMEDLKEKLESYGHGNRPILGSFSACSNVTGIFSDTREIARLLHKYGGFACFDFAASGPYVEIEMRSGDEDGYDAIFLSPHKFLGGPGTPGILLMSKALYRLTSLAPSTCGGGTVSYVNCFSEKDTLYLDDIEERENAGTPQIIQIIRAALTFWVKEHIGHELIERQEHYFIEKALKRLLPNQNIWILGNTRASRLAVLSFLIFSTTNSLSSMKNESIKNGEQMKLYMWGETGNKRDKPLHGPFVASLLNDLFGIQARGGCACAGPYGHALLGIDETYSLAFRSAIKKGYAGVKPGWTRISFPYYMSNEEFEFILAAVEFVATYGQRFLPFYRFNLRTGHWTFQKKSLSSLLGMESKNDFCVPDAMQTIAMGHKFERNLVGTISKYASYLETAKYIANLLPKFPPPRKLREDIDIKILNFRV